MPRPVSAEGLRYRVDPRTWTEIRRLVVAEWDSRCAVCRTSLMTHTEIGKGVRLFVFSVWRFDNAASVANLDALVPLCPACHPVASYRGWPRTPDDVDQVIAHLIRVNRVTDAQARSLIEDARDIYRDRCQRLWTVDLGPWPNLVDAVGGRWLPGRAPAAPDGSDLLPKRSLPREHVSANAC